MPRRQKKAKVGKGFVVCHLDECELLANVPGSRAVPGGFLVCLGSR